MEDRKIYRWNGNSRMKDLMECRKRNGNVICARLNAKHFAIFMYDISSFLLFFFFCLSAVCEFLKWKIWFGEKGYWRKLQQQQHNQSNHGSRIEQGIAVHCLIFFLFAINDQDNLIKIHSTCFFQIKLYLNTILNKRTFKIGSAGRGRLAVFIKLYHVNSVNKK